jgi:hypothetical protein
MSPNIRKIVLGSVVAVIALAIGVWWYSGFSLDFMKFFAAELTPTPTPTGTPDESIPLSCIPATQTATVGAPITVTAVGGIGDYSWTAPDGSPATQSGQSQFQVTYATAGVKKILLQGTRLGNVDVVSCTVIVAQ